MPFRLVPGRARRALSAALSAALALAAACGENPVAPGTGGSGGTSGAPSVGTILRLNAYTDAACDTVRTGFRGGRVMAVGERSIVVADTLNPAGGFTSAEYASFAASFDTLAYPVDVRHFGEPTDLDDNGRVIIFFTTAVNALTPRRADYIVGGFFWERDLFPKSSSRPDEACPGSNDGELFYMLAPDPTGTVNGNVRSKSYVASTSVGILAHEFQHLINASRRLYVVNTDNYSEDVWLNEGLSHAAEELLFFRAGAAAPRRNLDLTALRASETTRQAFNSYDIQNFVRFSDYLAAPEDNSPYAPDDSLATRGATWAFLRYAADRAVAAGAPSDSAVFYNLVNSSRTGLSNLQQALAGSGAGAVTLADWFRDWSVANYADDQVAGLDARFTHPSWAFRDVLTGLSSSSSAYPLATRTLTDGQAQTLTLDAGGASYLRFTVPAGGQGTLTVRSAGGAAPPATLRASLVSNTGVTTYDAGTATVTAAGGAGASATYTLALFNADLASTTRAAVTVTASGLTAAVAERAPAYTGPTLARLSAEALSEPPVTDAPVIARLRTLGRPALAGRVAAARAAYAARRADAVR